MTVCVFTFEASVGAFILVYTCNHIIIHFNKGEYLYNILLHLNGLYNIFTAWQNIMCRWTTKLLAPTLSCFIGMCRILIAIFDLR